MSGYYGPCWSLRVARLGSHRRGNFGQGFVSSENMGDAVKTMVPTRAWESGLEDQRISGISRFATLLIRMSWQSSGLVTRLFTV